MMKSVEKKSAVCTLSKKKRASTDRLSKSPTPSSESEESKEITPSPSEEECRLSNAAAEEQASTTTKPVSNTVKVSKTVRMAPQQPKKPKSRRAPAVKEPPNHKITEFFHVRRSTRKTSKKIEEEEQDALQDAILSGSNEKLLDIYTDDVKGRGIRTQRKFEKGEFVIEYKGEMMEYSVAKKLEEEYSNDEKIGSYMYFFNWNNKKWCVDATKESKYKGRLINHSVLRPNLKTKVVAFNGEHHLILIAKRDIEIGEELLYDYGDRTASTIEKNPWLLST